MVSLYLHFWNIIFFEERLTWCIQVGADGHGEPFNTPFSDAIFVDFTTEILRRCDPDREETAPEEQKDPTFRVDESFKNLQTLTKLIKSNGAEVITPFHRCPTITH
jgi:hypothetical protein